MPGPLLSDKGLEAVRAAAAEAEHRSQAEVVPYVVGRADDGEAEAWQAATLGAVLAVLAAALWRAFGAWGGSSVLWLALPAWLGAAVGYLAGAHINPLARRLAGPAQLQESAMRRAKEAFLDEGVFATHGRTGILVFLALRERRAVILADDGINAHVAPEEWQTIVDRLTASVGAGEVEAGLVRAIQECGALVAERCGPPLPTDVNELHDDPRVRPR